MAQALRPTTRARLADLRRQAMTVAAPPSRASEKGEHAFDGTWDVRGTEGENCRHPFRTWRWNDPMRINGSQIWGEVAQRPAGCRETEISSRILAKASCDTVRIRVTARSHWYIVSSHCSTCAKAAAQPGHYGIAMPLSMIAIILIAVFVLLIAAPFAIQIGGVVALITFFLGFGVLSIFRLMQLGGSLTQESASTSSDFQSSATRKAETMNHKIWQMLSLNRSRLLDPNSCVEWKPSRE